MVIRLSGSAGALTGARALMPDRIAATISIFLRFMEVPPLASPTIEDCRGMTSRSAAPRSVAQALLPCKPTISAKGVNLSGDLSTHALQLFQEVSYASEAR